MTNCSFPAWIRRAVEKSKAFLPKDYHEEVIAREKLPCIDLSKRDGRAFADALLHPPKPGKRLREAADSYLENDLGRPEDVEEDLKRLRAASKRRASKMKGDSFTMTIQIDECVAREILDAQSVCEKEGGGSFPEEFLVAIKEFFPELVDEYYFLPWADYGES